MSIYCYLVTTKRNRNYDFDNLAIEERAISKYAAKHSMLISEWFRERDSTLAVPLAERPIASELSDKLQPGDSIIFATFGSFASTPKEALLSAKAFLERGIHLHFVDLDGEVFKKHQDLLFIIFETLARQARSRRSPRMQQGRSMPDPNEYKGGVPPYGFILDKAQGKLVEAEWRRNVIKLIARGVVEGIAIRPTCRRIQEELKVPISVFTVQRLRESEEVKRIIEALKKRNEEKE